MSLSIAYESLEDASMRLIQTVVMYDGEPVYITNIKNVGPDDPKGDIFRVYCQPLPYGAKALDEAQMRKFISSKKFDLAAFPMGFMNYGNEALYCSRKPKRQQKQGLSNGTFDCTNIRFPEADTPRLDGCLPMKEFHDCIKGVYPSFQEAVSLVQVGGKFAVAFSRTFAVVQDEDIEELLYIYHKKQKVGFIMDGKLKLAKVGLCLKEALAEEGVVC